MEHRRIGRYVLYDAIASGGMASVHLGRMMGPAGFSRTVAIKRLHPHHARDPEFVSMFLDEARLAARIQHPNVVPTLDVVASDGELFLVMEYVFGESLAHLVRGAREQRAWIPLGVVSAVMCGALSGLHAAHEAQTARGESLEIVHRDVSPQNILVGADGVTRVADFGVAKAASRLQSTRDGEVKGKLSYMAPEQILRRPVDRRADLYAAGVVLWEATALRRMFVADDAAGVIAAVLEGKSPAASTHRQDVPSALDAVVRRAMRVDPDARFTTAMQFVEALEAAVPPAPAREVAAWVQGIAGAKLEERRGLVTVVEQSGTDVPIPGASDLEGLLPGPKTPDEARKLAELETSKLPAPVETVTSRATTASIPMPPPQPPSRPRTWWAAGAIALVTANAIGAYAVLRRPAATQAAAAPPPSASAPPASSPPPPELTVSVVAEATSAPPPVVSAPPKHGGGASRPGRSGTAAAPATARPDCDPPYVVDSEGVKRFKPACI